VEVADGRVDVEFAQLARIVFPKCFDKRHVRLVARTGEELAGRVPAPLKDDGLSWSDMSKFGILCEVSSDFSVFAPFAGVREIRFG